MIVLPLRIIVSIRVNIHTPLSACLLIGICIYQYTIILNEFETPLTSGRHYWPALSRPEGFPSESCAPTPASAALVAVAAACSPAFAVVVSFPPAPSPRTDSHVFASRSSQTHSRHDSPHV